MRAYRVASGRTIAPFGDAVRELYVGTETVAGWQEGAIKGAGLELTDVSGLAEVTERPCLVLYDDVWLTEMALRQFVADVMRAPGDLALALPDSPITRATEPMQDARRTDDGARVFDVFMLRSPGGSTREELVQRCAPQVLQQREASRRVRVPPAMLAEGLRTAPGRQVEAPVSARLVANVRHWFHLLRLSQLSVGVTLLDRLRHSPRKMLALRFARRADPWAIARKLNFVDPTARVHPTADLECAVIGPGAVVRAHAHVHRSVIGAQVDIGDHAAVMGCTIAERAHVMSTSYLALCASMPGGTLANYKVQLSLFGRDVFLTSSAKLIDAKLRGEVRVEHDGALVPVGPFLGVCLGHRVTLGADVAIEAGRAIPNGSLIVGEPSHFASQIGAFPEGTVLTVRNGRVEPVQK